MTVPEEIGQGLTWPQSGACGPALAGISRLPACSSDPASDPHAARLTTKNRPVEAALPCPSSGRAAHGSRSSRWGCCPFAARGHIHGADLGGGEAFALLRTHETPGDPRVRALPSPYRA